MKQLLILLTMVLVLGCLDSGGDCPAAQYLDQGVAVTHISTDVNNIFSGNPVTLTVDVNNLGEAVGDKVVGKIIGPDTFFDLSADTLDECNSGSVTSKCTLIEFPAKLGCEGDNAKYCGVFSPPDPARCLEGDAISGEMALSSLSGKRTPSSGVPLRFQLSYDYRSESWADIVAMTEKEWAERKDNPPTGYQWRSAGPIRIKITLPDRPALLRCADSSCTNFETQVHDRIPIRIKLEYALTGDAMSIVDSSTLDADFNNILDIDDTLTVRNICAFATTGGLGAGNIPNCINQLTVKIDPGFHFVADEHTSDIGDGNRAYCGGTKPTANCWGNWNNANEFLDAQTVVLRPAKVSTISNRPEEYVLWIEPDLTATDGANRILDPAKFTQDSFKITATAEYHMQVVYHTTPIKITNVG